VKPVVRYARNVAKRVIPKRWVYAVRKYFEKRAYAVVGRRNWLERPNTPEDNHVEVYWKTADHPNRIVLTDTLCKLLSGSKRRPLSVLEFGSHVGVNLHNLRRAFTGELAIFAVEPNRPAADSLREKLPGVRLLVAEDEVFTERDDFPEVAISVSFVNAVFYCMDEMRTKNVLRKLARISEVIVIGDEFDNIDGRTSLRDPEQFSYQHPFATWLREFGFSEIRHLEVPEPKYAIRGLLVASRPPPF